MQKKLYFFLLFFLISAPGYAFAGFPIEVPFGIPLSLPHYIQYFFWLAMALGGILAVISLIFSGIKLMLAMGDPAKISDAKSQATSAVLGLVFLLSSVILIKTINPKLEDLSYKEGLRSIGTIFLIGDTQKDAPMSAENINLIKQEYQQLFWKNSIVDLTGKTISNCKYGNPNFVYIVYWYKDYNFKDLYGATRLKCGDYKDFADFPEAKSYKIIGETPGVYFYDGPNCFPKVGSKDIPKPFTASVPEDLGMKGEGIQSIRIVNGQDTKKGPFYGVIYFDSTDYRTSDFKSFQHFLFSTQLSDDQKLDNNSRCFTGKGFGYEYRNTNRLPSIGVSFAIYQWVGFKDDGSPNISGAGNGITLHSEIGWGTENRGGLYDIKPATPWLLLDLKMVPINYPPNASTQEQRKNQCKFFDPYYSCLQSFEIKGNYLLLVLSKKDEPYKYSNTTKAQAFPISQRLIESYKNMPAGFSRERGTLKLDADFIGSKSAYYMEIIPLAERFK